MLQEVLVEEYGFGIYHRQFFAIECRCRLSAFVTARAIAKVQTSWLLALLPVTHDRRQFIQLLAEDGLRGRDHLILSFIE